jgi:hypothetical protein
MKFPAWAEPVANPDDELCECGLLPYIAEVILASANGKRASKEAEHLVCKACLMLEQASTSGAYQEAKRFADSLVPPEREVRCVYRKKDVEALIHNAHWYKIADWEGRGWLTGWQRQGQMAAISYSSVVAFLANPDTWVAWQPDELTEQDLRLWTSALRGAWPWRWVEGHEAAAMLGYSFAGLWKLCRDKVLRGAVQYQRHWFIRSTEVERFRCEDLPKRNNGPEPMYGEKMVQENSYMPVGYRDAIRDLGKGNFSAGLRYLYENYMAQQARAAGD